MLRWFGLALLLCAFRHDEDVSERLYIQSFQQLAVSEMQQYGIPASITLAQALVESDAGRSVLAVRANNHFGIKCKSWWTGGKYYYADDDTGTDGQLAPSCFRIYTSAEQSFADHSLFLKYSARYRELFNTPVTDYRAWARGLQQCGYATSPGYAEHLIEVIERFRLYELDHLPATQVK